MRVMGIDPGTSKSGCVLVDGMDVLESGEFENADVGELIHRWMPEIVACEWIQAMGMKVGAEVFETCRWVGCFEVAAQIMQLPFHLVYRTDVKLHLCNSSRAKDPNVTQAIRDLYPRSGGGSKPEIGTKSQPGPLYGVSGHAWQALGVALALQYSNHLSEVRGLCAGAYATSGALRKVGAA